MTKLADVLNETTWRQGNYRMEFEDGRVMYCLVGAVREVSTYAERSFTMRELSHYHNCYDYLDELIIWNDRPDRTWLEVQEVIADCPEGDFKSTIMWLYNRIFFGSN